MNNPAHPTFKLFVPIQAVGANLVYWDLFNGANSGIDLHVWSVVPIVSGAATVSGTLAVDLFLTRTTAVGTGGTAASRESATLTVANFVNFTGNGDNLTGDVTARLTPTGGATAGAVLGYCSVFTEETAVASYFGHTNDLVRRSVQNCAPVIVPKSTGLRVVQGSVASVGNIGFDVIFQAVKK